MENRTFRDLHSGLEQRQVTHHHWNTPKNTSLSVAYFRRAKMSKFEHTIETMQKSPCISNFQAGQLPFSAIRMSEGFFEKPPADPKCCGNSFDRNWQEGSHQSCLLSLASHKIQNRFQNSSPDLQGLPRPSSIIYQEPDSTLSSHVPVLCLFLS